MLQSLFRSQILSLGAVFLAIFVMFILLFRSVKLALIALVPNLVAVPLVLGLMGGLDIPLDFMTITIAAIAIGIGVDDTIHYVHRFGEEVALFYSCPFQIRPHHLFWHPHSLRNADRPGCQFYRVARVARKTEALWKKGHY
jgi:hypothetical protein